MRQKHRPSKIFHKPKPLIRQNFPQNPPTFQPAYKKAPRIHTDCPGRVVYFNEERGLGFIDVGGIAGQGNNSSVFVHQSDVEGWREPRLNIGLEVMVDIVQGSKGLVAVNVRII